MQIQVLDGLHDPCHGAVAAGCQDPDAAAYVVRQRFAQVRLQVVPQRWQHLVRRILAEVKYLAGQGRVGVALAQRVVASGLRVLCA